MKRGETTANLNGKSHRVTEHQLATLFIKPKPSEKKSSMYNGTVTATFCLYIQDPNQKGISNLLDTNTVIVLPTEADACILTEIYDGRPILTNERKLEEIYKILKDDGKGIFVFDIKIQDIEGYRDIVSVESYKNNGINVHSVWCSNLCGQEDIRPFINMMFTMIFFVKIDKENMTRQYVEELLNKLKDHIYDEMYTTIQYEKDDIMTGYGDDGGRTVFVIRIRVSNEYMLKCIENIVFNNKRDTTQFSEKLDMKFGIGNVILDTQYFEDTITKFKIRMSWYTKIKNFFKKIYDTLFGHDVILMLSAI